MWKWIEEARIEQVAREEICRVCLKKGKGREVFRVVSLGRLVG